MLALLTLNLPLSTAHAQGTAFTYQGQLQNTNGPVHGTYNFNFSLFNTNINGTAIAGPVTASGIVITNGLFTVTLDFGASVWNGETNWLQIAVETNDAASFTNLSPRQQLTPVPDAIFAETASNLSGTVSASQLASIGNTNVGASGNFFIGGSGNPTTFGINNTANGLFALQFNTSGSFNIANGVGALYLNTSGDFNTANGFYALANNTNGSFNVADGGEALFSATSGTNNIALGYKAGYNISTGSSNIDIGNQGLSTDTNIIRIGSTQSQTYLAGVITGNGAGLTNLNFSSQSNTGTNTMTRLLFPFVTDQLGYSTGIAIANTTADPFGTVATNGTATIYCYGAGAPSPNTFTTSTIAAGTTYTTLLSSFAPGFQGYLIVVCNFPLAHGYGFLQTGTGSSSPITMTPALVLPSQRSIVLPESLGQ